MNRRGTREGGGWLRENLIRRQVGNSSIRRRIYKTAPAVRGHHKSLTLSAAAAAAALDLGRRGNRATAARGEYTVGVGQVCFCFCLLMFIFVTFVVCGSFRHALPEILSIFATKPSK